MLGVYFLSPSVAEYNEKADVLFDQQKYTEAFTYYKKAADKKDGYACYRLGILYLKGLGITASESKAVDYFQKSADLNDANGQYELAYHYYETHDYRKAHFYAMKSALQENLDAACLLGFLYDQGKGVTKDEKKAFGWYEKAANKNTDAKMNLAMAYFTGRGTEKNYNKAFQLFTELAGKGETDSFNFIGYMYDHGFGTSKNVQQACMWFKKGAEAGDLIAQYNWATKLWRGEGVPQDQDEALRWYKKSATGGNEQALQFINGYEEWKRNEEIRKEKARRQKESEAPRICPGCQGTGRVLAGTGKWENCGLCGGTGVFQSFTGRWKDMIDAIDNMW